MQENEIILQENLEQSVEDSLSETETETEIETQESPFVEDSELSDVLKDESKKENSNSLHLRELRKRYRELKKENYELRNKEKSYSNSEPLPNKPTLSECDYDETEYEKRVLQWHELKRSHEENDVLRRKRDAEEQEEWASKIKNYETLKKSLPFSDKDDVEEIVSDFLSKEQMGAILNVCDNPALVLYALSKNSAKLEELSKQKDYLKFAVNVAKIESSIKVSKSSSQKTYSENEKNVSSKNDSLSIKRLVEKAIATEGGIYNLLKARPELKDKIHDYL